VCKTKCRKAYTLTWVKAHHDHQNSANEMERPENESPDKLIVNRETTYSLINGRFRRELSQKIVILEI
jgi:hypothetical protein